jgi:hypothetical protein
METKKPPEINQAGRFVVIWPKKLKAKSAPIYYPTALLIPKPEQFRPSHHFGALFS